MKSIKPAIGLLCLGLCFCSIAQANEGEGVINAEKMLLRLKENYPGTSFDEVKASIIPGLFEVKMGRNIAYFDSSAQYAVFGHIYELKTNTDLTAKKLAEMGVVSAASGEKTESLVDIKSLQAGDGIAAAGLKGAGKVSIVTDPICGYCRELEKSFEKTPQYNITYYLVAYQGEESRQLSNDLLCASNPLKAYRSWMRDGIRPLKAPASCNKYAAIERNMKMAQEMNIKGTPTLITGDGRVMAGAMQPKALIAFVDGAGIKEEEIKGAK